jgi:cyclopropane fatty-acyl-phospholipid synthase-like methyltransferase
MSNINLTSNRYWEDAYQSKSYSSAIINHDDYRELPSRRIFDLISRSFSDKTKKILEIGAGNSDLLLLLAKEYKNSYSFSGLDYSKSGCDLLREKSKLNNLDIEVIYSDIFADDQSAFFGFDVVYSIGVVEHFSNLQVVIDAVKSFCTSGGIVITIIPNMNGVIGFLTRIINKKIYDLHNPHNLMSLKSAHSNSGLKILSAGYLCSNNFGVLSSCFNSPSGFYYHLYVLLSRISKVFWKIETIFHELPKGYFFSPYLYVVAKKEYYPEGSKVESY